MKKEEQTEARKPNTGHLMLILIGVVVVIVVIASLPNQGESDLVTGKAVIDDNKANLAARIEEKLNPEPVQPSIPNEQVLLDEKFKMAGSNFPVVKKLNLKEGARYTVSFETDKPIQFVAYTEKYYQSWLETGFHSIAKASTQFGFDCCKTIGSYKFDVNFGEGGTFYFVFDDMKIPDKSQLPAKGKLKVIKNEDI